MTFQSAQSVAYLLSLPARDFVHRSYQLLLGRTPSASEQSARERSLYLGCGRIAMIAEIHQSVEAFGRRNRQREQGINEEFLESLYQNYLGRSADPDGLAHYGDLIKRKSRAAVESDLAASKEAIECRSLSYELERLVMIHKRSRQWWRWLGRARREQQMRNIESEGNAVRIARQETSRTQEHGQAVMKSITGQSREILEEAVNALREEGKHAFAALAVREADLRADLDQARIDMHKALMLIRDDAQARFDRLVESQRAERAAAAPRLQKTDARRLGPHAREILQRMQMLGEQGGHA